MSVLHKGKNSQALLRDMIALYVDPQRVPSTINIITDTSDLFRVNYDDVLILNDRPYFMRNYEREGRFGIDEQPKYWVRRAIDLVDGSVKIIKMVFPERFEVRVGGITFDCVRSPKKEARILDLTRGHPHFMQGFGTRDSAGNVIRIIDHINGTTIDKRISALNRGHEDYFFNAFPMILSDYIKLVKAIKFLHDHGEKHGDIRRDHIIKDRHEESYRWIDFDYNYRHRENMFGYDLVGLGNVLVYLAGCGDITVQDIKRYDQRAYQRLTSDDMNIIFHNRVVNLQKVYPYIPDRLNLVLLHFSAGAEVFYDDTEQFLNDLHEAGRGPGN